MDIYREKRQRSIFVSVFLVALALTTIFGFVTKAWGAPGDSEADPITDGYQTFPVAFRCPDVPHETQTCVPGLWYFGSLIGSSDYDDWIGSHAASNKWETKYNGQVELLTVTKETMQSTIDLYKNRITEVETELTTMAKTMRWNSTVAFITGAVVFTALSVALTAIIYQVRTDIEDTTSTENGMTVRQPVMIWRFP